MIQERILHCQEIGNERSESISRALEAARFFERDIKIPEAERRVSNWEIFSSFMNLAVDFKGRAFDYNTLISDDGGGRIATIFLRDFFSIGRREVGKAPLVYFISPHKPDLVNDFVGKMYNSLGKVLVVTELIRNGKGTRTFGDALKKNGVEFDVASVSSVKSGVPEQLAVEYGAKIFVGESKGWGVGEVFHKQPFNAVGALTIEGTPHLKRVEDIDASSVVLARKNISVLAQEVVRLV